MFDSRCIIDSVTGNRNNISLLLEKFDNSHLDKRRTSCNYLNLFQSFLKFFICQLFDISSLYCDMIIIQHMQLIGNCSCCTDVITCQHFYFNSCTATVSDGFIYIWTQWIRDYHKTIVDQSLFYLILLLIVILTFQLFMCKCKQTACFVLEFFHQMEILFFFFFGNASTERNDLFRISFDIQNLFAIFTNDRTHVLVLR